MDTSIKRLLEVAGVDITKGKAKELTEVQQTVSREQAISLLFKEIGDWETDALEGVIEHLLAELPDATVIRFVKDQGIGVK